MELFADDPVVLQVRAFAYQDTQRYRVGTNFSQLPINRPKHQFNPLRRDGAGYVVQGKDRSSRNGLQSYSSASLYGGDKARQYASLGQETWAGPVVAYESKLETDDMDQAKDFWAKILAKEPGQQENLVSNIAEHLAEADSGVRDKVYGEFQTISKSPRDDLFSPTLSLVQHADVLAQPSSSVCIQIWVEEFARQRRRKLRHSGSRGPVSSSRASDFLSSHEAKELLSTRMRTFLAVWTLAYPTLDCSATSCAIGRVASTFENAMDEKADQDDGRSIRYASYFKRTGTIFF